MIKKLKDNINLIRRSLRYTYGLKANCIGVILMLLTGLGMEILYGTPAVQSDNIIFQLRGGFFMSLTGVFLVQMWQSFNTSCLILSSPQHRTFLCTVPALLQSVCILISFTLTLLIRLFLYSLFPYEITGLCGGLILAAVVFSGIMLFTAVCYRYYILSLAVFVVCFLLLLIKGTAFMENLTAACPDCVLVSLPAALIISYGILFLGILLYALFMFLLYKKPYSKPAQGTALRRYL